MTSASDKYPELTREQTEALTLGQRRQYEVGILDIEDVRKIVAAHRRELASYPPAAGDAEMVDTEPDFDFRAYADAYADRA